MDADKKLYQGAPPPGKEEDIEPLFSAFKPKPKPPPRPAPSPVKTEVPRPAPAPVKPEPPPPAQPALESRLAEMERRLQDAARKEREAGGDKEILNYLKDKVGELENKLRDSQEKALAFAFELKGREEARKESRREMEEFLGAVKQQQSASENEKLRIAEIQRSRERVEALEKKLLDLSVETDRPRQDPALAARLQALEGRVEELAASLQAGAEKSAADAAALLEKAREELRRELQEGMARLAGEIRVKLEGEAGQIIEKRLRPIPALIDKSSAALAASIEARVRELQEAVKQISGEAAAAGIEAEKTVEWLKGEMERRGRSAVDGAAGAYDFGFIQATLDNLEKSFGAALENLSRAGRAAQEGGAGLPPELLARRNAQALADAMKELGGTLSVFKRLRGDLAKGLRRRLTGS